MTQRLFIALPIDHRAHDFQAMLGRLRGELTHETGLRWPQAENIHLTLQFIGDTQPADCQRIMEDMDGVVAAHRAFSLTFDRLGTFGKPREPRVLWLGTSFTPPELTALQADIHRALAARRLVDERQTFAAHITLCRIKFIRQLPRFQRVIQNAGPSLRIGQEASEVKLFWSILRPQGPIYQEVKSWKLV